MINEREILYVCFESVKRDTAVRLRSSNLDRAFPIY